MFGPDVDLDEAGATVRSWSSPVVAGVEPGDVGVVLAGVRTGLDRLARLGSSGGPGGLVGSGSGLGESGSGFDGECLRGVLEGLELAQRVLDAAKAHVAYGLVRCGGCDETGLTAHGWLADRVKQPSGVTRSRFRVSAVLVDGTLAPVVDEALSAGVIGWA
ncbi:MAG: hypothetical protein WBA45_00005, partial [Microthrixaceae bacterium]